MIYTVNALGLGPERKTNWGYYFSYDDAEKSILENYTDLFEIGYYQYAVITAIPEGLCAISDVLQWFDYNNGAIKKINKPEEFKNFYIGL